MLVLVWCFIVVQTECMFTATGKTILNSKFKLQSTPTLCSTIENLTASPSVLEDVFDQYILKFNKSYSKGENAKMYTFRYKVFQSSLKRHCLLSQASSNGYTATYGINQYSDLTPEEFRSKYLTTTHRSKNKQKYLRYKKWYKSGKGKDFTPRGKSLISHNITSTAPLKWDWRDHNAVTNVKNQRTCGACWAFSSVEAVEGKFAMVSKNLTEFSVQQVIDCALDGNYGCKGGDPCRALTWMRDAGDQLVTEAVYPLTDTANPCQAKQSIRHVRLKNFICSRWIELPMICYFIVVYIFSSYKDKELDLVDILYNFGPVSVTVDATSWQDYLGGIVQYHCSNLHNHAVLIVGYDRTGPIPYYIVKNSWGTDFGVNGYLYIQIGKNVCGIVDEVARVTDIAV